MPLRSRLLGRLVALTPNRKFAATRLVATMLHLVPPGAEPALARANAAFVWSYYLRFVRLISRRGRLRAYERVVPRGEERLAAAVSRGRGLILLSFHLGDFDVGGGWLAERHGISPVVVSRGIKPRWRGALFSLVRRRCGVIVRAADSTSLEQLELDLEHDRAVLVMLDRLPAGQTVPSRLLGAAAVAPLAAARLAARTGAPLLPVAAWRETDGRTVAWFGEPRWVSDERLGVVFLAEVAEQLGDFVREHPEQWHVPADLSEMPVSALREGPTVVELSSPIEEAQPRFAQGPRGRSGRAPSP